MVELAEDFAPVPPEALPDEEFPWEVLECVPLAEKPVTAEPELFEEGMLKKYK